MAQFKENMAIRQVFPSAQYVATLTVAELTAASTSQALAWSDLIDPETLPPTWRYRGFYSEVLTPFVGGATVTLDVGKAGALTEVADAHDLMAVANTIAPNNGALALDTFTGAAYVPVVTVTSDVNVDTLTAGKVRLLFVFDVITSAAAV